MGKRMNMVQTMYTRVCKCKKATPVETSRNQRRRNGGEKWRREFNYDISDTL
jgi:hypothetical protein